MTAGPDCVETLALGDGLARLRRVAFIVYAGLALLLGAMPRQVADRLDDFEPNALAHAGKLAAENVAWLSGALGVQALFDKARAAFLGKLGER